MRALSIRQPYAELILRGIKTAELRSMSTMIVGERFFIYACKAKAKIACADLVG
jgi:predicted transcriptional regulator